MVSGGTVASDDPCHCLFQSKNKIKIDYNVLLWVALMLIEFSVLCEPLSQGWIKQ